jgi:hypothetical protein
VTKKPSPQQRAIERKRARLRERRAQGFSVRRDPETYDFAGEGQHFDRLSDKEWAPVWKTLQSASPNKSLDEVRLRRMIDSAAFWSGWFVGCGGEVIWYPADYRRFARKNRCFLEKLKTFRREVSDFIGPPPDDYEPFWEDYQELIFVLDELGTELERDIAEDERKASTLKDHSNAAQPKLDAWRAKLLLIWAEECNLQIANTKQLRGFLIAALLPYMPTKATDRMAKQFITRWLAGKVPKPFGGNSSPLSD